MSCSTSGIVTILFLCVCSSLALSTFEKDCAESLSRRSGRLTKEQIRMTCQMRKQWLDGFAEMERNGFQESKFTKAAKKFSDSLNPRNRDGSQSDNHLPGKPHAAKPRKEYRMLSDDERRRFHNAVLVLKATQENEFRNQYDFFVDFHTVQMAPEAHWGACFLGWHREFLLRFEQALQRADPDVTIPYWDSTMDEVLGDSAVDTMMWTEDFLGNKDGDVVTGPFAYWLLGVPSFGRDRLFRSIGSGSLLTDEDLDYVINGSDDFRNVTWHVDPFLEAVHGGPHGWSGGVMLDIGNSPADPAFYLHHSFVDLIFLEHQKRVYRDFGRDAYFYPTFDDEEAYGVGELHDPRYPNSTIRNVTDSYHLIDRPMLPFDGVLNQDGLSDDYQQYYYFDARPTCSAANQSCGSPYLFCIQLSQSYKCAPKLKPGANCAQFAQFDSCYGGQCSDGVCSLTKSASRR